LNEVRISELDLEEISVRNMVSYYRVELESIEDGCYEGIAPNLREHLRELGLTQSRRMGKRGGKKIILTDFAKTLLHEIRTYNL
jgi:hypothetical protein